MISWLASTSPRTARKSLTSFDIARISPGIEAYFQTSIIAQRRFAQIAASAEISAKAANTGVGPVFPVVYELYGMTSYSL